MPLSSNLASFNFSIANAVSHIFSVICRRPSIMILVCSVCAANNAASAETGITTDAVGAAGVMAGVLLLSVMLFETGPILDTRVVEEARPPSLSYAAIPPVFGCFTP